MVHANKHFIFESFFKKYLKNRKIFFGLSNIFNAQNKHIKFPSIWRKKDTPNKMLRATDEWQLLQTKCCEHLTKKDEQKLNF